MSSSPPPLRGSQHVAGVGSADVPGKHSVIGGRSRPHGIGDAGIVLCASIADCRSQMRRLYLTEQGMCKVTLRPSPPAPLPHGERGDSAAGCPRLPLSRSGRGGWGVRAAGRSHDFAHALPHREISQGDDGSHRAPPWLTSPIPTFGPCGLLAGRGAVCLRLHRTRRWSQEPACHSPAGAAPPPVSERILLAPATRRMIGDPQPPIVVAVARVVVVVAVRPAHVPRRKTLPPRHRCGGSAGPSIPTARRPGIAHSRARSQPPSRRPISTLRRAPSSYCLKESA